MNLGKAASVADFAIKLLQDVAPAIQAGVDVIAHIKQGTDMLSDMKAQDRGPTEAEYEALKSLSRSLHDEFQRLGAAGTGEGG